MTFGLIAAIPYLREGLSAAPERTLYGRENPFCLGSTETKRLKGKPGPNF
jgi:hypothetical protein